MRQRVGLHIGFWVLYLLLSSYITADLGNSSYREYSWGYRLGIAIAEKIGIVAIQASIFYWLFYSFLPKNKWKNILSILELCIGIFLSILAYRVWVGYVVYPWVHNDVYPGNPFGFSLLIISFINIYSFVGLAGGIKLIRNKQQQREIEQKLIQEKLESELHFLRAQINPHFFFNTLNNIYGLARKKSENTAEVVMRLSKLMRFILYECTSEKISIIQEIKVLEDYFELERIRYGNRLSVNFTQKIDDINQPIAPLLLLPFVENSFKHGASEMRFNTQIDIDIILENQELFFSISNHKDSERNKSEKGLGLQNVKRQLVLIYPKCHNLEIEEKENSFQVKLKIDLK